MYHKRAKINFSDLHHNDMALLFRGGKISVVFQQFFFHFFFKTWKFLFFYYKFNYF